MNNLITISGVRGYINENGTAQLNLEDCVRGLGFIRTAASGNEVVRWERVEGYLAEIGVPTCGHEDFIPENVFYRLAMKAKNEAAESFQAKIANEILPAIRKHGGYLTPEKLEEVLCNPDTIIKLAQTLKAEQEKNRELVHKVKASKPAVAFVEKYVVAEGLMTLRHTAKILDIPEKIFSGLLREHGVIFGRPWQPASQYVKRGYFEVKASIINGHARAQSYFTPEGITWIGKIAIRKGW